MFSAAAAAQQPSSQLENLRRGSANETISIYPVFLVCKIMPRFTCGGNWRCWGSVCCPHAPVSERGPRAAKVCSRRLLQHVDRHSVRRGRFPRRTRELTGKHHLLCFEMYPRPSLTNVSPAAAAAQACERDESTKTVVYWPVARTSTGVVLQGYFLFYGRLLSPPFVQLSRPCSVVHSGQTLLGHDMSGRASQ